MGNLTTNRWSENEMKLIHQYKLQILKESGGNGVSMKVQSFLTLHKLLLDLGGPRERTVNAVCKKLRDVLRDGGHTMSRAQQAKKRKVEVQEQQDVIEHLDSALASKHIEQSNVKPSVYYISLEYVYGKVPMNDFMTMWAESKAMSS